MKIHKLGNWALKFGTACGRNGIVYMAVKSNKLVTCKTCLSYLVKSDRLAGRKANKSMLYKISQPS